MTANDNDHELEPKKTDGVKQQEEQSDNVGTQDDDTAAVVSTAVGSADDDEAAVIEGDNTNSSAAGDKSVAEDESTENAVAKEEDEAAASGGIVKKVVPPELPLDWTKMAERNEEEGGEKIPPADAIRYPWDVMDLPRPPDQSETYLTIVGTAGQKITRMGSNLHEYVSTNLTHLVLRSHLIRTMEGLSKLKDFSGTKNPGTKNLALLLLYVFPTQEAAWIYKKRKCCTSITVTIHMLLR